MKWEYGLEEKFDTSASGEGLFICNEGNFQYGNATLSYYDPATKSLQNEVFYRANAMKLGDVAQSMTIRNGIGWVVVNNSHVVLIFNVSHVAYNKKLKSSPEFTSKVSTPFLKIRIGREPISSITPS